MSVCTERDMEGKRDPDMRGLVPQFRKSAHSRRSLGAQEKCRKADRMVERIHYKGAWSDGHGFQVMCLDWTTRTIYMHTDTSWRPACSDDADYNPWKMPML